MIYLNLFLSFLKIGAVSFGGGYGMISLMREEALSHGWLTDAELLNFIAIAESTPGPIAVNMATFVGSSQGGFFGAIVSTLGVVLPSFVIILLIAALMQNFMKYKGVQAALSGIRPVVVGLILSTAVYMMLGVLLSLRTIDDAVQPSVSGIIIFSVVAAISYGYKRWKKVNISPIYLILISAVLGVLLY